MGRANGHLLPEDSAVMDSANGHTVPDDSAEHDNALIVYPAFAYRDAESFGSSSSLDLFPALPFQGPARALLKLLQPVVAAHRLARVAADEAMYFAHLGLDMSRNFADAVVAHVVDGPPRPSWNVAFHLLTRMIRSNVLFPKHTLDRIRRPERLFSGLLPVAGDIKITPFSFTVNKSMLLRAERESSTWWGEGVGEKQYIVPIEINDSAFYEITGEWVECTSSPRYRSRRSWSSWFTGHDEETEEEPIVLYLHGGAYSMLSAKSHRTLTSRIARVTGSRLCVINYRLAPEHPFPAALHDAFATWLWLTEPDHPAVSPSPAHCFQPQNIVVMGDSAGGGLSTSLMLYLKYWLRDADGQPRFGLPGGAVLLSPWVDLTCSQPSWTSNSMSDYLPSGGIDNIFAPMYGNDGPNPVAGYIWGTNADPDRKFRAVQGGESDGDSSGAEDPSEIVEMREGWNVQRRILDQVTHPLVSPLYGDLRGLPPVLIQAGDAEVLRDETIIFARKYSHANRHRRGSFSPGMNRADPAMHGSALGHVRHELYTDQVHVFQAFPFLQCAKVAIENIGRFYKSLYEGATEFAEDEALLTVTGLDDQEGDVLVTFADLDDKPIEGANGMTGADIAKELGDGEVEMVKEAIADLDGGIWAWMPRFGTPLDV